MLQQLAPAGASVPGAYSLMHESTKHLFFELGFTLEEAGGENLIS